MSTTIDNFTYWVFLDLVSRRIVPNWPTLRRWMAREEDPFPAPVVLAKGRLQASGKNRYSGRRVAWRASEVEEWLSRRPRSGAA